MPQTVNFIYDGLHLTPVEYARLLYTYAETNTIHPDVYSNGGVVEELEQTFATWLGKERAIFMPTGTLANHVALRQLAGTNRKIIVQAESHIYNDTGDCAQTLSGLNLIPLSPQSPRFRLEKVQEVVQALSTGRVQTRVGVIAIESPVRRQNDAMFGYDEMQRISRFAQQNGISMHLDGARLFIESVHFGMTPAQYASLFDTVYISLSKCFNASAGAILAGAAHVIDYLHHTRRMFGGSLAQAWPHAVVALQFVDGFIEAYRTAWQTATDVFHVLDAHDAFRVEYVPNGTHIVHLHVAHPNLEYFASRLHQHHIHLPTVPPHQTWMPLKINPSLNRVSARDLADAFIAAVETTTDRHSAAAL